MFRTQYLTLNGLGKSLEKPRHWTWSEFLGKLFPWLLRGERAPVFAAGLAMECEGEMHVKDDAKGFDLRRWKNGTTIGSDWNDWGGGCRGKGWPRGSILAWLGTESFDTEQEAHRVLVD